MTKLGYMCDDIGEIPEGWRTEKLKEIATVRGGKRTPIGEGVTNIKSGYPFVRVTDFRNGTVDEKAVKYISLDTYRKLKSYAISSNDVYVSIAGTIGLSGIVPKSLDGAILTENAAKLSDLKRITKEFLSFFLNSDYGQAQISSMTAKTSQPKLALSRLREIIIPLPRIAEQQKIAEILTTADRKIELIGKEIQATEKLKKGLMKTLLTRGIGHTKFKMTEIGEIPEEWEIKRIEQICEAPQYGYTEGASSNPIGPKFLRITDIQEGTVNWDSVPFCKCPEDMINKYKLKKADILFARTGATTGKCFIVDEAPLSIFASYLIRIRAKEIAHPVFLYMYLNSEQYWRQIKQRIVGSAQGGVNASLLSKILVSIPPLSEQQKIAGILSTVDKKLETLHYKKSKSELLKKGLMQVLLTGQVRVNTDPAQGDN